MLVNFEREMIFLQTPRTGSRAVDAALLARGDWVQVGRRHFGPRDLVRLRESMVSGGELVDRFLNAYRGSARGVMWKFAATVREPYAMLGSYYRHVGQVGPMSADWIWLLRHSIHFPYPHVLYRWPHEFFGETLTVLRYETLWEDLWEWIGESSPVTRVGEKTSEVEWPDDAVVAVRKRFGEDIRGHGYEP